MNRYVFIGFVIIFLLTACSGSVETSILPVREQVSPPATEALFDASVPTEPGTPTDTEAPKDEATSTDTQVPMQERELEIITLLPKDGIPAIDNPVFISAEEADLQYEPDELVIGVNFDGDARAYSIPMLSSHEIVNDTVGSRKIAVTW